MLMSKNYLITMKKMNNTKFTQGFSAMILVITLTCFGSTSLLAQEGTNVTVNDFELWAGLRLNYKPTKAWRISLQHEYRFKDDASVLDQNFTELEIKRKLPKGFSLAGGARFIRHNDTEGGQQGIENRFRWNADIGYKTKFNRLALTSRLRYQSRTELDEEDDTRTVARLKLGADYNIKNWKLDPQFSIEAFNNLVEEGVLSRVRLTFGTTYRLKKIGDFTAFYRFEQDIAEVNPFSAYIIGVRYAYNFKTKKK